MPGGRWLRRPKIPVVLEGPRGSHATLALLDSGSDITLVPRGLADILGLRLAEVRSWVGGLGAAVPGRRTIVHVSFSDRNGDYRASDVPAFVPDIPVRSVVLGGEILFDQLGFSLYHGRDLIEVETDPAEALGSEGEMPA